jgi:hypothetical protein
MRLLRYKLLQSLSRRMEGLRSGFGNLPAGRQVLLDYFSKNTMTLEIDGVSGGETLIVIKYCLPGRLVPIISGSPWNNFDN